MSERTPTPLESNRAYRYLVLVELVLTIAVLALTVAAALGLL